MTKDEAKEFLNRGYQSRIRIRAKKERIENWRRIAESITAAIKPVAAFSSMPSKKVEDCVCNIIELQEEIQEEIDGLVQVEREIGRAITKAVEDLRFGRFWKCGISTISSGRKSRYGST